MTPQQKIKREILLAAGKEPEFAHLLPIQDGDVSEKYGQLGEENHDWLQDYLSGFRSGQFETGLPSQYSRHYEAKEVAIQCCDGSWVGWTFWHGGGKYGEPESIDWLSEAYDLDVTETEKLVIVREFKKRPAPG